LDIIFADDRLLRLCNDSSQLRKRFGSARAAKIRARLDAMKSIENLEEGRLLPGRCHELVGDRKGQLAIDVGGGLRLVFEPANDPIPRRPDGGLLWTDITVIRILEVVDYHA
jgi:plasmid maintenance system killer protein